MNTYLTRGEGGVGGTAAQRHGGADLRQAAPAAPAEAHHQAPSRRDPSTRGHGRQIASARGQTRLGRDRRR
jgi:hypothetical protein